MNNFDQKQQAKKERFETLSNKATSESIRTHQHAKQLASAIPFGQPILVGHHSETRDRNFRGKIHNTFKKSFDLQEKADYYTKKAASVGTGGISSDDPEAISKLQAELANAETAQARMKAANKAIRTHKTDAERITALISQGFSETTATKLLTPDFCNRVGFADYALTNNNANIRRIKLRIAELEQRSTRENIEVISKGYIYSEDTEENRVMFIFEGKPIETIRTLLKNHAFKWSPTRGAWVRHLNSAGLYAASMVRKQLDAHPEQ